MADDTNTAGLKALQEYLKDCDAHAIVPDVGGAWHAAFQAGRASLAASAGSEPMFWVRLLRDGLYEGPVHHKSVGGKMLRDEKPGEWTPLYTHPYTPEGMAGWKLVPIEPTEAMKAAAIERIWPGRSSWTSWAVIECRSTTQ